MVVDALFEHVREALEDHGDAAAARQGIEELFERGNGARIQRELLSKTGDLGAVVRECARITMRRVAPQARGPHAAAPPLVKGAGQRREESRPALGRVFRIMPGPRRPG